MILSKVKTALQLPPIFVEALRGGPFSGTILKMLSRKEIPVAVLAQAVGQPNPFPCAHCEQLLRNSDSEERRMFRSPQLGHEFNSSSLQTLQEHLEYQTQNQTDRTIWDQVGLKYPLGWAGLAAREMVSVRVRFSC